MRRNLPAYVSEFPGTPLTLMTFLPGFTIVVSNERLARGA